MLEVEGLRGCIATFWPRVNFLLLENLVNVSAVDLSPWQLPCMLVSYPFNYVSYLCEINLPPRYKNIEKAIVKTR